MLSSISHEFFFVITVNSIGNFNLKRGTIINRESKIHDCVEDFNRLSRILKDSKLSGVNTQAKRLLRI